MKHHALLVSALCALVLSTGAALAQSPAASSEAAPAKLPPPSDEQPSEGEALAAKQFKWLDLNGDGYLERGEVALFPRLSKVFDEVDTNHDGKVSFEEIRAYAKKQREQKKAAEAAETKP
ncbi:MAG: EF-hand domain-containing protein [Curvibacter sp.]|nr:EF-hand domain-containing protein [Curvibacter sp.]